MLSRIQSLESRNLDKENNEMMQFAYFYLHVNQLQSDLCMGAVGRMSKSGRETTSVGLLIDCHHIGNTL